MTELAIWALECVSVRCTVCVYVCVLIHFMCI